MMESSKGKEWEEDEEDEEGIVGGKKEGGIEER